jgi:signal peptidase I
MNFRTKTLIKNIISSVIVILIMIVGLFSITGVVFNYVYTPAPVSSFSMYPTLNKDAPDFQTEGDWAYLNKFAEYNNNDIIIAKVSWHNKAIIKRLIASPGDTLEIRDETTHYGLYVNEKLVYNKEKTNVSIHGILGGTNRDYETYLKLLNDYPNNVTTNSKGNQCFKLNKDQYFLMGDNWEESTDCLNHGPVAKSEILGRVDFVIPMKENRFWSMLKQMIITTFKI